MQTHRYTHTYSGKYVQKEPHPDIHIYRYTQTQINVCTQIHRHKNILKRNTIRYTWKNPKDKVNRLNPGFI